MVYGDSGMGKTEFSGSAVDVPSMSDVFMISAEKGQLTIAETPRIINKDRLFMVDVDDIGTCEQIRKWLIAHCKFRDEKNYDALMKIETQIGFREEGDTTTPPRIFKTVIIDSLTEIQAFAMYKTLGMSNNIALDAELPDSEWSHYNKILNRMQLLARAFRDLPMHVIYVAQQSFVQDETKAKFYQPMLMGQMGKRIQGFVDILGYLTVVDGDKGSRIRRLWIQPVGKFQAKNRMSKFQGNYIDDPSMTKIVDAIGMVSQ